ncbi:hypothetical protein LOAG_01922 [Loa loa]|uniref:Uncharacterized protein n=1 Tax=Loa loa TaxID=7209 RepID=A0A1S0U7R5_LOALO|nr:hypothetical protein LOAG_01922 [Loa loa]EFO26563.1 hypothetical protein LOAG_01922 [Loa loa]
MSNSNTTVVLQNNCTAKQKSPTSLAEIAAISVLLLRNFGISTGDECEVPKSLDYVTWYSTSYNCPSPSHSKANCPFRTEKQRGGRAQQIYTSSQKRLQVINELTSSTNFEAQMKTKKLHPSKT